MIRAWRRWAFNPVDTAPMAALRIACGLLTLGWALSLLPDVQAFLADDGLTAGPVGGTAGWWTVGLVSPYAAVGLMCLAAVGLVLGWRTRVCAVLVAFLLIALQRRNVFVLNSGDLLLREMAIFVALMPSGECWSLDARRRGESRKRAPWGLRLLQVQVSLLYLFSVTAKLGGDSWQNGTAVGKAVQIEDLQRLVVPEALATSVTVAAVLTYGTLLVEAFLIIGLWVAKTRWWAIGAGIAIHLGIEATMLIGWFSLTIIACYLAFVPAVALRRAVLRAPMIPRQREQPAKMEAPSPPLEQRRA